MSKIHHLKGSSPHDAVKEIECLVEDGTLKKFVVIAFSGDGGMKSFNSQVNNAEVVYACEWLKHLTIFGED